ncbi:hypothetical protein AB0O34_36710 [Sphaerisporangium sp. NPDC088356]|uniref:hypothetical protein n=1 Tax=Sphaerisporangium sp. NPDC088356 TaxID=3154871 RepID=UPI00343A744F
MKGFPQWLRALVAALIVLPLLLLVLAFSPALLFWPFLPKDRRDWVLEVLDRFVKWISTMSGGDDKDA